MSWWKKIRKKNKRSDGNKVFASKLRTMTLSLPKMVEGYDKRGSRIRRSLAWILTRRMIACLSASSTVGLPWWSSRIQFLETAVFFFSEEGWSWSIEEERAIWCGSVEERVWKGKRMREWFHLEELGSNERYVAWVDLVTGCGVVCEWQKRGG